MTELEAYARKSADIFYRYATEKNTAMARYGVASIINSDPFFDLIPEQRLSSVDGMVLQIGEALFNDNQFKRISVDTKTKTVRILPSANMEKLLLNADPKQVFFVYDLRFLITRVSNWYRDFGDRLGLPSNLPATFLSAHYDPTSSEEQRKAIDAILSHPFTYIWGAPGTGKTQFVLAQCLLHYVQAQKPVLITAPTNRAVEQMLYGVLPVLEANGMEQEVVLRLGTPTKEFAARYPKICENGTLVTKLEELKVQRTELEERLRQFGHTMDRYEQFNQYLNAHHAFKASIPPLCRAMEEYAALCTESDRAEKEMDELSNLREKYMRELSVHNRSISSDDATLAYLNSKVRRYNAPIFRSLFRQKQAACTARISELEAKRKQTQTAVHSLRQRISDIEEKLPLLIETLRRTKKRGNVLTGQIDEHLSLFIKLNLTADVCYYGAEHNEIIYSAIEKGRELFRGKTQEYADLKEANPQVLLMQKQTLEAQLAECNNAIKKIMSETQGQKNRLLIVAATIDGCLAKVLPNGDYRPHHVFLDEAGYAPLIKAATLTAFRCPLTLLGDHMQLPPVCEINDELIKTEEYAPIALWAQSALYLEDLFCEEPPAIQKRYLEHQAPHFTGLYKSDLTYSFRFGQELASVLAGEVYSKALEGSASRFTEILYIDAPALPDAEKRTSRTECEAIRRYVARHPEEEIGILTPYNNQKRLLRRSMPAFAEINTVHGAQGREWDCVILSVVDTTNKWFTDSASSVSNGKKVINTAVSRAKRKLILVCDANYWKSRPRQLIGKLLSIATEVQDN
ncbi:MAG: AAA family ATPase [Clostridia bacterium]|nr:AAA family ATPase [Clostridia bacterium]